MTQLFHSFQTRLLAAPLILLAGLAGCSAPDATVAPDKGVPAFVAEVRAGDAEALQFVGEVRAARRTELAFPVSGRVTEVMVDVGDTVQAGQALAIMDLQPVQAQLGAAQGSLAGAEAKLQESRQRLERMRRVQVGDAISAGEMEAVSAEVAAAEAAVLTARSQKQLATWTLEQSTLRAPAAGRVAGRLIEPGHAVGPGAAVMLIDGDARELSVLVPANMVLTPRQSVHLTGEGMDMPGKLLRISPRLEAGGSRRVFLAVPETATVGATWTVSIRSAIAQQGNAQVPLRAVMFDVTPGTGRVLRLAGESRKVASVPVKLGEIRGDSIEVLQGLAAGERVVVAGAAAIRPGSLVQPLMYTSAQGREQP
ncbi:efflux RND transporter periplasmic adaptor subunit [Burkholderiaceae bacterium DAT-1]|nr:efflux RND transporter periplasmic adaptor subunit [Burkholderiaceae bacterium DAT-1]